MKEIEKITILTLANMTYYQYLLPLVKSVNCFFNEAKMEIYLVDFGGDKELEEICSVNSNYNIHFVKSPKSIPIKCYCTNARADLFYQHRRINDDILLWIDADSIILKSCDDLGKHLRSCELTMRAKSLDRFAAGVIGIGYSDICHRMVDRYRYMVTKRYSEWMANQECLNVLYGEFKDIVEFKPLPKIYCDVWLSDEGVIWAAKADKKMDQKYVSAINSVK